RGEYDDQRVIRIDTAREVFVEAMDEEHGRRDDAGCGRDREARKCVLLHPGRLDIKTCQTQRTTNDKHKSRQPAERTQGTQRPRIHKPAWGLTKGQGVREEIVSDSKATGRACQTGHFTIQTIETRGQQNHECGMGVLPVMGSNHTEEATHEVRRCKEIRKKIFTLFHAPSGSFRKARIVSPPLTTSPTCTTISAAVGSSKSVREPKRIKP